MEEPPPFRAVAPGLGVPPAVESAVMKALVKDRDQRYASALDFARDFMAPPSPPPWRKSVRPFHQRRSPCRRQSVNMSRSCRCSRARRSFPTMPFKLRRLFRQKKLLKLQHPTGSQRRAGFLRRLFRQKILLKLQHLIGFRRRAGFPRHLFRQKDLLKLQHLIGFRRRAGFPRHLFRQKDLLKLQHPIGFRRRAGFLRLPFRRKKLLKARVHSREGASP